MNKIKKILFLLLCVVLFILSANYYGLKNALIFGGIIWLLLSMFLEIFNLENSVREIKRELSSLEDEILNLRKEASDLANKLDDLEKDDDSYAFDAYDD